MLEQFRSISILELHRPTRKLLVVLSLIAVKRKEFDVNSRYNELTLQNHLVGWSIENESEENNPFLYVVKVSEVLRNGDMKR